MPKGRLTDEEFWREWEKADGFWGEIDEWGGHTIETYCKQCHTRTMHRARGGKKGCLNCGLVSYLT